MLRLLPLLLMLIFLSPLRPLCLGSKCTVCGSDVCTACSVFYTRRVCGACPKPPTSFTSQRSRVQGLCRRLPLLASPLLVSQAQCSLLMVCVSIPASDSHRFPAEICLIALLSQPCAQRKSRGTWRPESGQSSTGCLLLPLPEALPLSAPWESYFFCDPVCPGLRLVRWQ